MSRPRPRASLSRDECGARDWLPTYPDYERAHELAILAVLVATLDVAALVLLAENREIGDDERPCWRPFPPTVSPAEDVLRHIDRLRRALTAYRRAAAPQPSGDESPPGTADDIPF